MAYKYTSCLSEQINDFLEPRKSKGLTIDSMGRTLFFFDQFVVDKIKTPNELTYDIIENWISDKSKTVATVSITAYISLLKQFILYLNTLGYKVALPEKPIKKSNFLVYKFTEDEVIKFILKTDELFYETGKDHYFKYSVLLRIVYGCGLRVSEVLNVKISDIDLVNKIFYIKEAKGNKDRIVPYKDSLSKVLFKYLSLYGDNTYLFENKFKNKYTNRWAESMFAEIADKLGIKEDLSNSNSPKGNSIHSFRHAFAVHSLQNIINKELDVDTYLTVLAFYMGHDNIIETQKYLHDAEINLKYVSDSLKEDNSYIFGDIL